MSEVSDKGKTGRKWVSTKDYKKNYDAVFGKKEKADEKEGEESTEKENGS